MRAPEPSSRRAASVISAVTDALEDGAEPVRLRARAADGGMSPTPARARCGFDLFFPDRPTVASLSTAVPTTVPVGEV